MHQWPVERLYCLWEDARNSLRYFGLHLEEIMDILEDITAKIDLFR